MKKELALRACTECIVHEHPLKREEIDELLNLLSDGWQLFDNQRIEKTYQCKQFLKALEFMMIIGKMADEENHHPKITVSGTRVIVDLITHSINGLSEKDFIIAAKIDVAYVSYFS